MSGAFSVKEFTDKERRRLMNVSYDPREIGMKYYEINVHLFLLLYKLGVIEQVDYVECENGMWMTFVRPYIV